MRTLTAAVVSEKLEEYLEENPKTARLVLDKAMMANRAREAARNHNNDLVVAELIYVEVLADARAQGSDDGLKLIVGGAAMPDKLRDCNENNPELTEIYIVEGDSAEKVSSRVRMWLPSTSASAIIMTLW